MKTKLSLLMAAIMFIAGAALAADASATWSSQCASCHGKDGGGGTTMGKKLGVKDIRQSKSSDAEMEKAIKEGVKEGGKEKMKAYGGKLSDADVKALVAYIKSLK